MSILLSLPHGYYRVVEKSIDFHSIETNESYDSFLYCTNSKFLSEPIINLYVATFNLEQVNLLYTIVIAYIIPLISIVICYAIMMNKLSKEAPVVRN